MYYTRAVCPLPPVCTSGLLVIAGCTLVIYLYLLDAEGVNTIVLATYTFSTGLEFWKVARVLRLRWLLAQWEATNPSQPLAPNPS